MNVGEKEPFVCACGNVWVRFAVNAVMDVTEDEIVGGETITCPKCLTEIP